MGNLKPSFEKQTYTMAQINGTKIQGQTIQWSKDKGQK
jgi:hypothetical protein